MQLNQPPLEPRPKSHQILVNQQPMDLPMLQLRLFHPINLQDKLSLMSSWPKYSSTVRHIFGQNQAQSQGLPQQQGISQFGQGGQAQQFGQQQQGVAGQQPGNSPFANPFQPFLQQSYVANKHILNKHPSPVPTHQPLQGLPQAQQLLPQTQAGYAQQGQNNFGAQSAVNSPDQQALANSQYTYGPVTDSQRPRQIYSNGPANNLPAPQQPLLATLPPTQPVAPALPSKQPNRFAAVPTAVVTASNSIDPAAVYVNKNGYAEKSGAIAGSAFPQPSTCSKHPNWEPCITKEIANQRFSNCCQRLGDGCSQLCSYDQTLTVLQLAVLTGRCPIGKVADMMICASGYEDATSCCQAHNVFEMGYEHCRPYCNPAAGLPNDGMLAEKYRAWANSLRFSGVSMFYKTIESKSRLSHG
uniref:Domain of unknown function DB domain-containing protein n=1 Tax=Ditylenchus dipsaci TaxID=166011 RepID=A0A915EEV8_9BILA